MSVSPKKANRLPHVFACLSLQIRSILLNDVWTATFRAPLCMTARHGTAFAYRYLYLPEDSCLSFSTIRDLPKIGLILETSASRSTKAKISCPRLSLSSKSKAITEKHHGRHDLASGEHSTRIKSAQVQIHGPRRRGVSPYHSAAARHKYTPFTSFCIPSHPLPTSLR